MENWGILVDYEWCTGCCTCETACMVEHDLPVGQYGIKVAELGPWPYGDDQWVWIHMPVPTAQCDLCAERVEQGKLPTCMHHCQAKCLTVGPVEELKAKMGNKKEQVLYTM